MREFKINGQFISNINITVWDSVEEPKGVIQIAHGVNSYAKRYIEFAEFLNTQGYIVYINDHIEHGKTRKKPYNEIFHIDSKNGVELLVDGTKSLSLWIKENHPDIKHFIFGQSLGSLIVRYILSKANVKYDGVVIAGTSHKGLSDIKHGIRLTRLLKMTGKGSKPSELLDKRVFRNMQSSLSEKVDMEHTIEWLTRDKEKTEINLKDEHLLRRISVNAYQAIFKLAYHVSEFVNLKGMDKTTPILFVSGENDPTGEYGVAIIRLVNDFIDLGMNNVQIKMYKEARHELFSEINRDEIFADIVAWFNSQK